MSDFEVTDHRPWRNPHEEYAAVQDRPTRAVPQDREIGELRELMDLLQRRVIWLDEASHQLQDRIGMILDQREDAAVAPTEKLPDAVSPMGMELLELIQRSDNIIRRLNDTHRRVRL